MESTYLWPFFAAGIPVAAPSLELLVEWEAVFGIMSQRLHWPDVPRVQCDGEGACDHLNTENDAELQRNASDVKQSPAPTHPSNSSSAGLSRRDLLGTDIP